jgi:hypothetical protein
VKNLELGNSIPGALAETTYQGIQTVFQLNSLASQTVKTAIGTFLKPGEIPENLKEVSKESEQALEQLQKLLEGSEQALNRHLNLAFKDEIYEEIEYHLC